MKGQLGSIYQQWCRKKYQSGIGRTISGGTLGDVMDTLTGDKTSSTPGLLTTGKGGLTDNGGTISIKAQANQSKQGILSLLS